MEQYFKILQKEQQGDVGITHATGNHVLKICKFLPYTPLHMRGAD